MNKLRAIVIDDDEITRILLMKYVQRMGMETYVASSSAEAIRLLENLQYQIEFFICDLFLPDGTGLELLKVIKEKNPTIDFVLITGHASIDTTIDAIRQGASDYIFKPVNFEEFSVRIQSLIQKRLLYQKLMEAEKKLMYQATITTTNHEINQPLTVIISGIDMLKMELERLQVSSPTLDNYLQLIHQSAQRIAKILKRFREISEPNVKTIPRGMRLIELYGDEPAKMMQDKQILVIEDEQNIVNLLKRVFTQWEIKGDYAECGWDGIRFLEVNKKYDLILMDLNLPDISYSNLFEQLKKIKPDCPIMIMSGYATEEEMQQLLDRGAVDFIMKPFNLETLFSKIADFFKRNSLTR